LVNPAQQPMRREDRERVIHGIRIVQQYRSNPFIHRLLWITQRGDDLHLITEYPEDSLQTAVNRLGPLDLGRTTRLFTQVRSVMHRLVPASVVCVCNGCGASGTQYAVHHSLSTNVLTWHLFWFITFAVHTPGTHRSVSVACKPHSAPQFDAADHSHVRWRG
jgi:hypothetical protein